MTDQGIITRTRNILVSIVRTHKTILNILIYNLHTIYDHPHNYLRTSPRELERNIETYSHRADHTDTHYLQFQDTDLENDDFETYTVLFGIHETQGMQCPYLLESVSGKWFNFEEMSFSVC